MEINKAETPEDEREISLNETSLKRPLNIIDVIGGHGPWQFRQWIVFFLATLCNSMVIFSALFLPTQTFCSSANLTGVQPSLPLLEINTTAHLPASNIVKPNTFNPNNTFHGENSGNICNSTPCKSNGSVPDISSAKLLNNGECWNSQAEVLAKICFMLGCALSGVVVCISNGRFGWRPTALLSAIILVASFLASSWADTAAVYLILRFILSLSIVNIYLISTFTLMKYVHEDFKLLYFLTGHLGWGMGHFLLPAVAWLAEDWKQFNIILSFISMLLSLFLWLSPESPSSFPKGGELNRTRKVLKYAAFTNGYSTTDVDLLSQNYRVHPENMQEFGTLAPTKANIFFILYSSALFLLSFTTAFLYFSTKWHSQWFKVPEGRITFSFLGTTEVASTVILLFLTCFVAIKYLWAIVSFLLSILMIVIFSRSNEGSSKSSAYIYVGIVFFAATSFTLALTKIFCHRILSIVERCNLIITGVAVIAGTLASSALVLKAGNEYLLLIMGIPLLLAAISAFFLPEKLFGRIS